MDVARDEIPHVLVALGVDEQHTGTAGNLLLQFSNTAMGLISVKHGTQSASGLLASAMRRFDSRLPHEAEEMLGDVPGLKEFTAEIQRQLDLLPKAANTPLTAPQ